MSLNFKGEDVSSSDSDIPLAVKLKRKSDRSLNSPPLKKVKSESSNGVLHADVRNKSRSSAYSLAAVQNDKKIKEEAKSIKSEPVSPVKANRKGKAGDCKDEETPVWEWWKENKRADGCKWKFLEHKGPLFAPLYEPLPPNVRFYYDGKPMKLSTATEEVATFYGKMLDHEYTTKDAFNTNYFRDWRTYMTTEEKSIIKRLEKCNFTEILEFFKEQSESRKNRTKEEKESAKKETQRIQEEYGFCTLDGYKQKIGNFRMEPPGLFRGRGNHPKMGMVKRRVQPEEVIINCSKDSKIPVPPAGHKWREVRHDPSVSWLACWTENIQNNFKYVMLNASSKLKGEKDWSKYETARKLHKFVDKIRADYTRDFKDKEMRVRQRAVALYFIDKLALRAGNEKDEDEADTVGCCSLRVEHIKLHDELGDRKYVVEFDFLGKDSIRYQNSVGVAKRVFKNLKIFIKNKQGSDDLFDRLNTTTLNAYLRSLMDGLTAKVFRTYNASKTLEEQLEQLTDSNMDVHEKILAYNRANRAVAVLCNHQRSVPKTFEKSMENLKNKIESKKEQIHATKSEAKKIKSEYTRHKDPKLRATYEKKKKQVMTLKGQLARLELQETDKSENKDIALGTSKLNYLDPRISIAWCKKCDVPIEKVYNKTQREKFQWAVDMTTKSFVFRDIQSDKNTNCFSNGDGNDTGSEEDFAEEASD